MTSSRIRHRVYGEYQVSRAYLMFVAWKSSVKGAKNCVNERCLNIEGEQSRNCALLGWLSVRVLARGNDLPIGLGDGFLSSPSTEPKLATS